MKRLFNVLSLSCFICFNLFSLDFNISGEFNANAINAFENAEYSSTSTLIQNDLNFSIFSENNGRLTMQLLSSAQLFSDNNSFSTNINQLFIQFPVKDFSVFYIGKKVVNLGFSRKFSLFNRINPVTINNFSSSFTGTGIIEFDAFFNDFLNFQTLLYYGDFNRTVSIETFSPENLNGLVKYDLYYYPFTFSVLLYAEGFRDFLYGLSGSCQLFDVIFYLDYLYKPYNGRKTADTETVTADSFANNSSLLFGLRYNLSGAVALNYEYLYNGSEVNNWPKHNMFLSLMWNSSFFPSLIIGSQFQLSASSFIDTKDVDLVFSPYISYSFNQNLSGGLSMRFPTEVMLELKFKY
jgi:hypothetical protein